MKIDYLSWDSEFFDLIIGKETINETEEINCTEFTKIVNDSYYDLVYINKYGNMLNQQEINVTKLELVDIMLTMSKKFDKNQYIDNQYNIRTELTSQELKECYYIAEQTAIVSRFYKEKLIGGEKTKELYRKWIDNSLKGVHSDGIFLYKDSGRVAVFNVSQKWTVWGKKLRDTFVT